MRRFVLSRTSLLMKKEISYNQKRLIIDRYRAKFNCNTLIETGTFLGETIWCLKDKFKRLYSIELSHDLAIRAAKRFSAYPHIKIIEGNSAEVLKELAEELDSRTLFWLDGHYSSEFYVMDEYIVTAKGDLNTPIEEELNIILNAKMEHVILIDDARLFTGKNDYPTIEAVKNKVRTCNKNYRVKVSSDIIQIIPTAS